MLERHHTAIENEYDHSTIMSDFVRKNKLIDEEIKSERIRNNKIHRNFLIIDGLFTLSIITIEGSLLYENCWKEKNEGEKSAAIGFMVMLFPIISQ